MEMIKIRIPVSEFTVTADAEGVIVMFPKPQPQQDTTPAIRLFQSGEAPKSEESVKTTDGDPPAEDWFEKELPGNTDQKKDKPGRKRAEGRYPFGSEVKDAIDEYRKLTGFAMAKIVNLVSAKAGIKAGTMCSYLDSRRVAATEAIAVVLGEVIGRKITLKQSMIDGCLTWGVDTAAEVPAEPETNEQTVPMDDAPASSYSAPRKDESLSTDEISKRIAQKTKYKSLPDRAFLSLGLISLLCEYLTNKKISEELFHHEMAVRIECSKNAVKLMLAGETEAIEKLIRLLEELLKVDIVRIENEDGKAYWEGV